MRNLMDDLRYAVRQMTKSPGFALVVVVTLALAIGANTAVFSVIDAVMLRPLPYDHPERLIEATSVNTHNPQPGAISYPDFFDWRSQNRTLEHLVSYHDTQFTLIGTAEPAHVDAEVTSWDLLPTLGCRIRNSAEASTRTKKSVGRTSPSSATRCGSRSLAATSRSWDAPST